MICNLLILESENTCAKFKKSRRDNLSKILHRVPHKYVFEQIHCQCKKFLMSLHFSFVLIFIFLFNNQCNPKLVLCK